MLGSSNTARLDSGSQPARQVLGSSNIVRRDEESVGTLRMLALPNKVCPYYCGLALLATICEDLGMLKLHHRSQHLPAQGVGRACEHLMAKAKTLTETESMAKALARALANDPSSFGAEQAKLATGEATRQLQAAEVDAETFGRVISRIGNHSQLRQWAVSHGFIKQADDALAIAVSEELAALKERLDAMADNK